MQFSKRTFGEMNLPGPRDQIATLEDVLAAWCSPSEAVLFRVGNVSGNMSDALAQSISLLKYIQQIRSAMVPALGQWGWLCARFLGAFTAYHNICCLPCPNSFLRNAGRCTSSY
nr:hypothetical protein PJ912_16355 [Pectobacterium colocasium]